MNLKPLMKFLTACLAVAAMANAAYSQTDDGEPKAGDAVSKRIGFVRDVQPIFKRRCLSCHGPDKQKGDFRLDVRETAFHGGESNSPNIVPGRSAASPLIRFIDGTGDLKMPPEGEPLNADEIAVLRNWIDEGADWPDEVAGQVRNKSDVWSLKPLARPPIPDDPFVHEQLEISAIDRFVHARLAEHNLTPSPQADRRTLIRRVYFDLIGLPPAPDEVDRFVDDPDPQAYEKLIDRLLDSPRYGERWARHWLDTIHFAESHGNDQDRIREHAWPYRDYVIEALNRDKPYWRFLEEQIAGDVLFPDDPAATVALGFLAAGPWDESSLRDIREDTLDRQIARYLDRDDMLATVINNVCSLTVQCARCHDHKFDPITQNDYYSLQAVFSGVERANRRYDIDPSVHRQRLAYSQRKRDLERRTNAEVERLLSDDVQQAVSRWELERPNQSGRWHIVNIESFTSSDGATLTHLPDGSLLSGGARPDKDTVSILSAPFPELLASVDKGTEKTCQDRIEKITPKISRITAIRLEVLTDESLPRSGPGRQDNGNFHLSEFEVSVSGSDKPLALAGATADHNQPGWEIDKSIDQNESSAWGIDPKEGIPHVAIFELKEPLRVSNASREQSPPPANPPPDDDLASKQLRFVLKQLHGRNHLIGRMRISVTDSPTPVRVDAIPDVIASILAIPREQRTESQKLELAAFHQMDEIKRALASLPSASLVYAAAADFEPDGSMRPPPGPRPIHVLHRGDIRQPREEAGPGTLTSVAALPSRFVIPPGSPESARRAELARWLTENRNPLTWRSIVNRVWHHHFGRGIVRTLNDFGNMGEAPSHPELLDWLAVEFRDSGQSFKKLHRLILLSNTYRQVVNLVPATSASEDPSTNIDPRVSLDVDNRLLWRMNRTRLDAESIRDAVLMFAGRLDYKMGGPSDRQFDLQPGIHVTPKIDYAKFDPDGDMGRRRSIYRFLFRTLPDPFMESLDCPSGDQMIPARTNGVTVQQALALWNDHFITRHSEKIANRVEQDVLQQINDVEKAESQTVLRRQIERLFKLIPGRAVTGDEFKEVEEFTRQHGLANLCRLLLNSNEFVFVN